MRNNIEKLISEELLGDDQTVANKLVEYLRKNNFEFYRDECDYWKNKIYFWVKYKDECVGFIAIKNSNELDNRWTVWSGDIDSEYLEDKSIGETLKDIAFKHVDECSHCGACGGGKSKKIFGREFDAVCGCTFRFDNPQISELQVIEYMIEAKVRQIDKEKRESTM